MPCADLVAPMSLVHVQHISRCSRAIAFFFSFLLRRQVLLQDYLCKHLALYMAINTNLETHTKPNSCLWNGGQIGVYEAVVVPKSNSTSERWLAQNHLFRLSYRGELIEFTGASDEAVLQLTQWWNGRGRNEPSPGCGSWEQETLCKEDRKTGVRRRAWYWIL